MAKTFSSQYARIDTRQHFNQTLRHLVSVTNMIASLEKGANLADILNEFLQQGTMGRSQVLPLVSLVLQEKLQAEYYCHNLKQSMNEREDFSKIATAFTRWTAIDAVCIYHHPHLGVCLVNPANLEHWDGLQGIKQNELIVIYTRSKKDKPVAAKKAIIAFLELIEKKEAADDPDFIGKAAPAASPAPVTAPASPGPAAAAAPAPPKGKLQLTPKYSVQVTNELFHNGNVEAWKNIIESYHNRHSNCRVIVYHEGELIHDLNALFKWGKVKHGGVILFQVSGPQIKNVSRLQKYLTEGASPRFETFMKHDVNKALELF